MMNYLVFLIHHHFSKEHIKILMRIINLSLRQLVNNKTNSSHQLLSIMVQFTQGNEKMECVMERVNKYG